MASEAKDNLTSSVIDDMQDGDARMNRATTENPVRVAHPLVKPPSEFTVRNGENRFTAWRRWEKRFRWYASAVNLPELPAAVQHATCLSVLGDVGVREYERHGKPVVRAPMTVDALLSALTTVFYREVNRTQSRYELFNIKQANRPLEEYMEDIEKKADECGFCVKCTPSITTTMFIIGLDSSAAKRHLIHHGQEVTSA